MPQKDVITTLYQLQKKYDCSVTSYFEQLTRSMVFTATLHCQPCFNVAFRISEIDIIEQGDAGGFEQFACHRIDAEFGNFIGTPAPQEEPIEECTLIDINEWRRSHGRSNYDD